MRRRPAHAAPTATLAAVGVILATTEACTPTIGVPVADHAADPACAGVVLSLPDSLGTDLAKVNTASQATAAWGSRGAAVTLRCGVEVPGPTTEDCVTVDAADTSVDWIVRQDSGGTWTFTTYGRDPAVEVVVPPAVTARHSTSFVQDLGPAVSRVPATRHCVGPGEA